MFSFIDWPFEQCQLKFLSPVHFNSSWLQRSNRSISNELWFLRKSVELKYDSMPIKVIQCLESERMIYKWALSTSRCGEAIILDMIRGSIIYIFLTPLAIRSENICVCAINDKLKAINWCVFVSCSETISCSLPLFSIDRTACRQINGLRRSENFVDLFFLSLIFFGWNIRFTHKPTDEINHKKM